MDSSPPGVTKHSSPDFMKKENKNQRGCANDAQNQQEVTSVSDNTRQVCSDSVHSSDIANKSNDVRIPTKQDHQVVLKKGLPNMFQNHGKLKFFLKSQPPEVRKHLWLDKEATYSMTEEGLANTMTRLLQNFYVKSGNNVEVQPPRILDATACVGGNAFSLTQHFTTVACEFDPVRFEMLKQNLKTLGAPIDDTSKLRYEHKTMMMDFTLLSKKLGITFFPEFDIIQPNCNHSCC